MISRVLSSRIGTLALAGVLALAAAAVVLIYVTSYREDVDKANAGTTVLVANQVIEEFTPGNQVVDGAMFREMKISTNALADGAVSDPKQLDGLVARDTIYPGEQLTTNQFQRSSTTSVAVKLKADQRAMAFPVDMSSGLMGELQSGDRVDIVATFDVMPLSRNGLPLTGAQAIPLTKTIAADVVVLRAPERVAEDAQAEEDGVLTLAVPVERVQHVAFAQERGDMRFALRPPGDTKDVEAVIDDVGSVLRGVNGARPVVTRLTGGNG